MFLCNTKRRTTVGRTPLDEWSARRRGDLPTVERRCVWHRNIKNKCSIYIYIYTYDISRLSFNDVTLILLSWRKLWTPNTASKWQMGLNSAFKGLSINVNWCFKVYICAYVGIKPVIITKCTVQHQKLNYCVLKRFINNSNLKYFLKRKALCCLTQSRGANSQNIITMGKIRMCSSPLQLLSNVFSLTIRHSRPLK